MSEQLQKGTLWSRADHCSLPQHSSTPNEKIEIHRQPFILINLSYTLKSRSSLALNHEGQWVCRWMCSTVKVTKVGQAQDSLELAHEQTRICPLVGNTASWRGQKVWWSWSGSWGHRSSKQELSNNGKIKSTVLLRVEQRLKTIGVETLVDMKILLSN